MQKSWSQQHLADACGLSLRTIQRVEQTGNASSETAMSLCSVFEISMETIKLVPIKDVDKLQTIDLRGQLLFVAIAMFLGSILGAIMMFSLLT